MLKEVSEVYSTAVDRTQLLLRFYVDKFSQLDRGVGLKIQFCWLLPSNRAAWVTSWWESVLFYLLTFATDGVMGFKTLKKAILLWYKVSAHVVDLWNIQDLKEYMNKAGEVTFADAHKRRQGEGWGFLSSLFVFSVCLMLYLFHVGWIGADPGWCGLFSVMSSFYNFSIQTLKPRHEIETVAVRTCAKS